MRSVPTLARIGLGLTLLAALVSPALARQARKSQALVHSVPPSETLSLQPTVFQWSELLRIQASLPADAWSDERLPQPTLDVPPLELPAGPAPLDARVRQIGRAHV